jgi:hypothetical protein
VGPRQVNLIFFGAGDAAEGDGMTEAEWLEGTDLRLMRDFLLASASDRKWRLFAVACCRRLWHHLGTEPSRQSVVVAEQFADGAATEQQLLRAHEQAWPLRGDRSALPLGAWPAEGTAEVLAAYASWLRPKLISEVMVTPVPDSLVSRCYRPNVLRDLFGNPFRPVAVDPAWLSWNGGTVAQLAQVAYEERHLPSGELDAARLAVLADALEEAGCADPEILAHLRGPGPHVRGCWAIDLLLGRT